MGQSCLVSWVLGHSTYVLVHQARLADAAVAEDNDLEEDLLAGCHGGRERNKFVRSPRRARGRQMEY